MKALASIGVLLLLATLSDSALAQNHLWSKRIGGSGAEVGDAITVDRAGNVLVAGHFENSVNFGGGFLASAGSWDIFVAKYSPGGVHLWSLRLGGTTFDAPASIAVDDSNDVVVTGFFTGTVPTFGTSAGEEDIFLAKFSEDGALLWFGKAGSTYGDYANRVVVDDAGDIILTGSFRGTINFGSGNLVSSGAWDIFVAKFAPWGGHLWSRALPGTNADYVSAVAVDQERNVIVTGESVYTNFGAGYIPGPGGTDLFLAKYNASGVHQWSKVFGGTGTDKGDVIAADSSGNILVAGTFSGTADFGGGPLVSTGTATDLVLAKYDPAGTHVWSQRIGGDKSEVASGIAVGDLGNVFLTGRFEGSVDFGGGLLTNAGASTSDIFIAEYSPEGAHVWSKSFGAAYQDAGRGIAVGPIPRTVVVTGFFAGTVDFGGGNLATPSTWGDVFVATYWDWPSAAAPVYTSALRQNYPNPFNPRTTIEYTLDHQAPVTVEIFNASGARVAHLNQGVQEPGIHRTQWDGRDDSGREVPSGVYLCRLTGVTGGAPMKMVLIK